MCLQHLCRYQCLLSDGLRLYLSNVLGYCDYSHSQRGTFIKEIVHFISFSQSSKDEFYMSSICNDSIFIFQNFHRTVRDKFNSLIKHYCDVCCANLKAIYFLLATDTLLKPLISTHNVRPLQRAQCTCDVTARSILQCARHLSGDQRKVWCIKRMIELFIVWGSC